MPLFEEENINNQPAPETPNEVEEVVEENKEEVVAEEAPVSKALPVEKPDADTEPYDVAIENARKTLYDAYMKSRKISNAITVVILVISIGAMLLITQENAALQFTGWALAGASLIGLVVYYMVNKNKFPNRTRDYIKDLTRRLNENSFADEKFTEVTSDVEEKMSIEDVIGDSVYDNLGAIASRNVVRGKYEGKDFLYGEVALHKANATKKDGPLFVGKYISMQNKLELRGRIIINLKRAETPVDVPTSIGNLDLLDESENMVIYGYKDTDIKAVLGTLFLSRIKELAPKDHLMNTNIVIWAGKTGVYLSYDDVMMGLPFDKPFDKNCNEQGVQDVLTAFECNEILGK